MFNLSRTSKIYITAPPHYASGGPELLHQLCAMLTSRGLNAAMYYRDPLSKHQIYENPVPERFFQYQTTYVNEIEDSSNNLLIVPETITRPLAEYKYIQKCEWWLGANNFFWLKEINSHKYLVFAYHWFLFIIGRPIPLSLGQIKKQGAIHLAQCWYAVSYLNYKGLHNVAYLSDYLGKDFFQSCASFNTSKEASSRRNIILYNPKRNIKYIKILKRARPALELIPIRNLSPDQVLELMHQAKIYADFGAHPGKDRMPREAAMCGCCIFTSTLGSADFFDDVPIPSEFKFDRKLKSVTSILRKIDDVFTDYQKESEKFDFYRKFIMQEQQRFESDVDKLFRVKPSVTERG